MTTSQPHCVKCGKPGVLYVGRAGPFCVKCFKALAPNRREQER